MELLWSGHQKPHEIVKKHVLSVDWEQVQLILHDMESDQRIFQDEIVALIWVRRQLPIEVKNPKRSMAIQKSDTSKG